MSERHSVKVFGDIGGYILKGYAHSPWVGRWEELARTSVSYTGKGEPMFQSSSLTLLEHPLF